LKRDERPLGFAPSGRFSGMAVDAHQSRLKGALRNLL
jgi:hypothetical protein